MADHQGENAQGQDEDMQNVESAEYNHALEAMRVLSDQELQALRGAIEAEEERRAEARRAREQLRRGRMYDEWYPKYRLRRERKDEDWEEAQEEKEAKRTWNSNRDSSENESDDSNFPSKYKSCYPESDDEGSYGDDEFGDDEEDEEDEECNGNDSDAEPPVYTDLYLQRRFEYERRHPRKYERTLNEGEMIRVNMSARIPISDSESESSGVSATGSSSSDSELGGEEGWEE